MQVVSFISRHIWEGPVLGTDIFSGIHSILIIQLLGHKSGLVGATTAIRNAKRKLAYLRHILDGITANVTFGGRVRYLRREAIYGKYPVFDTAVHILGLCYTSGKMHTEAGLCEH